MAKKNRAPRLEVDEDYIQKGQIIPGTTRVSDCDSWYKPQREKDFDMRLYRKWVRERKEDWEREQKENNLP